MVQSNAQLHVSCVWLMTSNQQIRELWWKVVELLGEEQTALQKEALAISAAEAA